MLSVFSQRDIVVLAFSVLSNWVGLGSLLDSLDYLDLTSLGLGGGESSGRTIFLSTGNYHHLLQI